jgi:hypothetical protein
MNYPTAERTDGADSYLIILADIVLLVGENAACAYRVFILLYPEDQRRTIPDWGEGE